MAKQLKDILAGAKASKVVPGSTGNDPGVDYAPKAPAEQDFVKKHAVEKHADRVGNGDDVYQATNVKHSLAKAGEERHGHKTPKDKKVYEAKEEDKCNMTAEGTACPVHEMADCSKQKPLKEVLSKKAGAGEWISDFQKSDNPKFAGKSQEKRKQMALAAYYAKQRNEEVEIDEDTMSVRDANKLQDKHASAAQHARKAGDKKAYDAHMQHAASIEDKVIQSKSGSTIAGKSLKAKSEKLFKDHPYGIKEEAEQIDEGTDLKKVPTHKLQAMWDKHKDEERPAPTFAAHLKRINTELVSRKKKGMKEEVEQVDEISKKTVASYSAKAGQQVKGNQPSDPDKLHKRTNREQGMKLAYKKYHGYKSVPATEEVEQVEEAAKWRKGPEGKSWKSNPMSDPEDDEGEKAVYGSSKLPNVPAHKVTGKITRDTYAKLGSKKSVNKLKYRGGVGFGPKGKLPEEVEQVDEVSMQRVQAVADRAKSYMKGSENEVDTKKFNQMNAAQKLARKKLTGTAKVPATEEVKEDLAVPLVGSNDDESAEMAKTQLRALANKALHLAMQLTDDQVVEPWVQSKIAVAKDYVTAVHDYMLYGDKEPEKEQTSPYEGGIDPTSGTVRNTFPSFSADVNTGRVV
jgi:hypothetical protein